MSVLDGYLSNGRITEMILTTSWEYSTGSLKGWESIFVFSFRAQKNQILIACLDQNQFGNILSKLFWNDFYTK